MNKIKELLKQSNKFCIMNIDYSNDKTEAKDRILELL